MNTFAENTYITMHRQLLIDMAMKYGLNDPYVIAQSQLVDRLIYPEQRRLLQCCTANARLASRCS
jgi:hypothetical protein